ncbi:MAG: DUF1854 domain-containing protein [Gemmatimonadetes bacterium]|nr:DUF1854 domain-containing protein [Gemmatimonadota bacterium]
MHRTLNPTRARRVNRAQDHRVETNEQHGDARPLRLERRDDGRLWAARGGIQCAVRVQPCFPWSEPARFLSLRDAEDDEFDLVRDPLQLDAPSRAALEQVLIEAGFVFELTEVVDIDEEVELRQWRVITRQGVRSFQTRLDDWPRRLPDGGLLIRDVAGDLYCVREPDAMTQHSRDLLWAFVDD